MIIDKFVEIKLSLRNINKIRNYKNDDNLKVGDIIYVPIEILDSGSHQIVKCKCDICGFEKSIMYQKYLKNINNGGYYACSSKCAQEKVKITTNKKWGVDYYTKTEEYINKTKITNKIKYGSDYYLSSKEGLKNIKEIILYKFGVDNPFKSEEIKEKIKRVNLEKWGVDNPSKSDIIKDKISNNLKESWNNSYKKYYKDNHNLNILNYDFNKAEYHIKCKIGHIYSISRTLLNNRLLLKSDTCLICNPYNDNQFSGQELKLREYINSVYTGKKEYNKRNIISPYELDIYLPELKLAFEYNGLYWHSSDKKEKDYHFNKHKLCKNLGIELIQIWEDDWLYKSNIIKSVINNKLKINENIIYARKCIVKFISFTEASQFLEKNHLMGKTMSKYNIGLFYNNNLVSVMTFGKLRKSLNSKYEDFDYEIYRYCNLLNTNIIGGVSKMLSFFKKNIKYNKIITYYDKSFGYKNIYEKIGFEFDNETVIDYKYIIGGKRVHRYNYRKQVLVKKGYDINKTEEEIMNELGHKKIYGVGNYKYFMNKEESI